MTASLVGLLPSGYFYLSLLLLSSLFIPTEGFYAHPSAVLFSIQPPPYLLTCEGCGGELNCAVLKQTTVAGLPQPQLSWILNGVTLSSENAVGHSNDTHIWSTLSPSLSGVYQCAVSDGAHEGYCGMDNIPCVEAISLSDESLVEITSGVVDVESVILSSCSSVLLRCGNLPPGGSGVQLHWSGYENGNEGARVLSNGDMVLSNGGGAHYHNGLYHCLLMTPNGNITLSSYNLTTEQSVLQVDDHRVSVEVVATRRAYLESETINLVCAHNVSSSVCPTVTWSHHGGNLMIATGPILTLESTSTQQAGLYCCSLNTSSESRHEACLQVDIFPNIDSALSIVDTVFLQSSNESVQVLSSLSDMYPLAWFRNGARLEGETKNVLNLPLNDTEIVYGVYQCFVCLPDQPKLAVSLTRLMPHGVVNPPSRPQFEEIPRVINSISSFFILVLWAAPVYRGGLERLSYRLRETRTAREWIVHSTSVEVTATSFANAVFSVEVVDETNSSVSEKSPKLNINFGFPACSQNRVLYPPSILLVCGSGWVDVSLTDSPDNTNSGSRFYYVRGSCTGSNGTTIIDQKLEELLYLRLDLHTPDTHCSLQAAATTEDIDSCAGSNCFCVHPDYIGYSAPAQCVFKVSFDQSEFTVAESEETVLVCVTMETGTEFSSFVVISYTDHSAQGSVDYVTSPTELALAGGSNCFEVEVVDDSTVEETEVFNISLSSTDPLVRVTNSEASVFILDNDNVTVYLKESSLEEFESASSVRYCIAVDGKLEKNISLFVNTSNDTAFEGVDYTGVHQGLIVSVEGDLCALVALLNNSILEEDRTFFVHIASNDSAVRIGRAETLIKILDDDHVTVFFVGESNRTLNETQESVQVCIEVEGEIARSFNISLKTISVTATVRENITAA